MSEVGVKNEQCLPGLTAERKGPKLIVNEFSGSDVNVGTQTMYVYVLSTSGVSSTVL